MLKGQSKISLLVRSKWSNEYRNWVHKQVLEIVEGKFLTLLQSRVTGQVPTNIRQLINSLFANYVENSVNKLKEKYNVVVAMSYCVTHRHYL